MSERDQPAPFTIIPPTHTAAPVVVHVPHSATAIPDDLRAQLLLTDVERLGGWCAMGVIGGLEGRLGAGGW